MGYSFPTTRGHTKEEEDGGLSISRLLSPRRYPRERPPRSQRLEVGIRRDRFARYLIGCKVTHGPVRFAVPALHYLSRGPSLVISAAVPALYAAV